MRTKGEPRRGRWALALPGALTVLMIVLAVLAAGHMGEFTAEPVLEPPVAAGGQETLPTPPATGTPAPLPEDGERLEINGGTAAAALLVLVLLALALLVRFLLRFHGGQAADDRSMARAELQQPGALALVADALPAWTEASGDLLRNDNDTSDAVIRCWLDLERLCAEAGAGREPTQTTTDFASAVSVALDLPPAPLTTLNRLYQRARFGRSGPAPLRDTLLPADRAAAVACIDELSAALAARRVATGDAGRTA